MDMGNKRNKKNEIIDVASRLFAENGFEKTTTRDICKATGMSHAMIYYYFKDKEAVLNEILQKILSDGLRYFKRISKSKKSMRQKLTDVIDMYARFHVVEAYKNKIFVHERMSLRPRHKAELDRKQRDHVRILVAILDELKKKKEMAGLDTTVAAFMFFGMVHWTYGWYDPEGKIKPEEIAHIISRIFTKGILSE